MAYLIVRIILFILEVRGLDEKGHRGVLEKIPEYNNIIKNSLT